MGECLIFLLLVEQVANQRSLGTLEIAPSCHCTPYIKWDIVRQWNSIATRFSINEPLPLLLLPGSPGNRILFVTTAGEVLIYDAQGKRVRAMSLPEGAEISSSSDSTSAIPLAGSDSKDDDDTDDEGKGQSRKITRRQLYISICFSSP